MDSLCEEDHGSVFSGSNNSNDTIGVAARLRSPSLPVVGSHPPNTTALPPPSGGIARSRSPSLPVTESVGDVQSVQAAAASGGRRSYYADRSDSGISDCSTHSSTLLSTSHMPIQEEEDENGVDLVVVGLMNGVNSLSTGGLGGGGARIAIPSVQGNSVVNSRQRDS